jgi:uridine kinase
MRTALIISGYLRTLKLNIPNIQAKVLDTLKTVDVYIHVTKNEDKEDRYLNLSIVNEDIAYINCKLKPVCMLCENNEQISNNRKENNTLNLWFKYYKLNELKKINETLFGKYDLVIKYRPDLNIATDNVFSEDLTKNTVYIPHDSKIDKTKLLQESDNYICDIFAYGSSSVMNQYFSIYKYLPSMIKKFGFVSETLLYEFLNKHKISYKLINLDYSVILSACNVFAICGDSGSGKTTLGNLLKEYFSDSFILECDRYHKWDRSDKNWKKMTHLNPDANYIAKMKEDIFDLKIGKKVHQVNYNHDKGKFTDKEEISSSNNIIVCGLHSLYHDNEAVYNLKIFMDTDPNLKMKWKIKRDTTYRNHTEKEVVDQINSRKKDYCKYVYPQKKRSDLIINFIPSGKSSISLRLFVKKTFDITKIIGDLRSFGIRFIVKNKSLFNEIIFNEYQKINKRIFGFPSHNNYYDYILFFIFNLMKD